MHIDDEEDLTASLGEEKLAAVEAAVERNAATAPSVGQAEGKRLQLKHDAGERITKAKTALKEAKVELKTAKTEFVKLGPNNANLLKVAKDRVEHAELTVEHYEAISAVLDSRELLELVEQWDGLFNGDPRAHHASLFLDSIAPEVEAVQRAAKAFVGALVEMKAKHQAAMVATNEAAEIARGLGEYGVKVRVVQPQLIVIQQSAALALRKAIIDAGLGLREHWVAEALRPDHYDPPKKAVAA